MPAAEDFAQYKLQFIDSIQHDYEVIRPVVLFAETIAERSRQTGVDRTVVGNKVRRFVMEGMLGLVDQRAGHAGRKGHVYPDTVAAYMLYVKQLYPPIHAREIVRILARKFGYKTNHHTVKRFFERHTLPVQLELAMPTFGEFRDAYEARWTVVRMWYEGWNKCSSLITSGRLLDNIDLAQLALAENKASVLLTIIVNILGLTEKNLITSGAAWIN